jgi:hypothetical protein
MYMSGEMKTNVIDCKLYCVLPSRISVHVCRKLYVSAKLSLTALGLNGLNVRSNCEVLFHRLNKKLSILTLVEDRAVIFRCKRPDDNPSVISKFFHLSSVTVGDSARLSVLLDHLG